MSDSDFKKYSSEDLSLPHIQVLLSPRILSHAPFHSILRKISKRLANRTYDVKTVRIDADDYKDDDEDPIEIREIWDKIIRYVQIKHFINQNEALTKITAPFWPSNRFFKSMNVDISKELSQAKFLSLYYERSEQLLDRDLHNISYQISHNFLNLRHLKLGFRSQQISDEDLKSFKDHISRITRLKSLSLSFISFQEISDKGFESLASKLSKYLIDLQDLLIDFSYCEGVTNKCFKAIGKSLSLRLNNLRKLSLSFWNCEDINDEGFEFVGRNIARRLYNLQELSLDFSYCRNITDTSFEAVSSHIASSLANLEKLLLDFSGCDVTEECKAAVHEKLRAIPSLEIS